MFRIYIIHHQNKYIISIQSLNTKNVTTIKIYFKMVKNENNYKECVLKTSYKNMC